MTMWAEDSKIDFIYNIPLIGIDSDATEINIIRYLESNIAGINNYINYKIQVILVCLVL